MADGPSVVPSQGLVNRQPGQYHGRRMSDIKAASGRFVIRVDPDHHRALREAATRDGVSLNEYCVQQLSTQLGGLPADAVAVLRRIVTTYGVHIRGVVVFGSWARGEAGPESDVDIMIVVDPQLPITRSLYQPWDDHPQLWDGLPASPHIVHLPEVDAELSGFWAEVAIDGIVLFDRDLAVSRALSAIRARIMGGELMRRQVNGQTYWVQAA